MVATALCQEKQNFVDIAEMDTAARWAEALSVMIDSAAKLGTTVPYMGQWNYYHPS